MIHTVDILVVENENSTSPPKEGRTPAETSVNMVDYKQIENNEEKPHAASSIRRNLCFDSNTLEEIKRNSCTNENDAVRYQYKEVSTLVDMLPSEHLSSDLGSVPNFA